MDGGKQEYKNKHVFEGGNAYYFLGITSILLKATIFALGVCVCVCSVRSFASSSHACPRSPPACNLLVAVDLRLGSGQLFLELGDPRILAQGKWNVGRFPQPPNKRSERCFWVAK